MGHKILTIPSIVCVLLVNCKTPQSYATPDLVKNLTWGDPQLVLKFQSLMKELSTEEFSATFLDNLKPGTGYGLGGARLTPNEYFSIPFENRPINLHPITVELLMFSLDVAIYKNSKFSQNQLRAISMTYGKFGMYDDHGTMKDLNIRIKFTKSCLCQIGQKEKVINVVTEGLPPEGKYPIQDYRNQFWNRWDHVGELVRRLKLNEY